MNFIKNVSIVIFSSIFLYYFKWYSIIKGGYLYRYLKLPIPKDNVLLNMQARSLFEVILFLIVILSFYSLFKFANKFFNFDKLILLIIVISPIIFELSIILYDRSCFKPWKNLNIFLWYFPMRLALWIFLYWFFRDLMPMLRIKRNLIIIGCVFIIFHSFKFFNKYFI